MKCIFETKLFSDSQYSVVAEASVVIQCSIPVCCLWCSNLFAGLLDEVIDICLVTAMVNMKKKFQPVILLTPCCVCIYVFIEEMHFSCWHAVLIVVKVWSSYQL